jgi:aquaporin Z
MTAPGSAPREERGPLMDRRAHGRGGLLAERFHPGLEAEAGVVERQLYDDWKRYGRHIEEYACEFALTLVLIFAVVAVVGFQFASSSPAARWEPSVSLRLFVTGLTLGGISWLLAISPPGKLSGAHVNPAASIGFWMLGKMHGRDVVGYVAAQLAGGACGALIGISLFHVQAHMTMNADLSPGHGVATLIAFLAEVAATFALLFVVYTFVSHMRLQSWTPAAAMLCVGVLVWLDGTISGAGLNPARWFGPALTLGHWGLAWMYTIGPLLGAILAVTVRRSGLFPHPIPHTAKIVHDPHYRSIFKHDRLSSALPDECRTPSEP